MKKSQYKVIKAFPGSPKVGTILIYSIFLGRYIEQAEVNNVLFTSNFSISEEELKNNKEYFEEINDKIICDKCNQEIPEREVLFISTDGKKIYEGDFIYFTDKDSIDYKNFSTNYLSSVIASRSLKDMYKKSLCFVNKENAKDYFIDNLAFFSLNDLKKYEDISELTFAKLKYQVVNHVVCKNV